MFRFGGSSIWFLPAFVLLKTNLSAMKMMFKTKKKEKKQHVVIIIATVHPEDILQTDRTDYLLTSNTMRIRTMRTDSSQ